MHTTHYEVIVRGAMGPSMAAAFDGLTATTNAASTVLRGSIDQAALHRVLDRVDELGLELLDIRPTGVA
jgi:class 3 adenylate cyclase